MDQTSQGPTNPNTRYLDFTNVVVTNFPMSGMVAGPDKAVQFNDAGAIAGEAAFSYDKTADTLTVLHFAVNSVIGDILLGAAGDTAISRAAAAIVLLEDRVRTGSRGTAAIPAYAFKGAGGVDAGMYSAGADTLNFATAGVLRFTISPTGFLEVPNNNGIGHEGGSGLIFAANFINVGSNGGAYDIGGVGDWKLGTEPSGTAGMGIFAKAFNGAAFVEVFNLVNVAAGYPLSTFVTPMRLNQVANNLLLAVGSPLAEDKDAGIYVKGTKLVIAWNNAGVYNYTTIDLTTATGTWTQSTVAP